MSRLRLRVISPLQPGTPSSERRRSAAARPSSLSGIRVGLLANGKVNGDHLLREIAEILHTDHGAVIGPLLVKPHASLPASTAVLDTFCAEVAVVLSAIGD